MSKKILVVDDEPSTLVVYRSYLKGEGFDVGIARSGEEALIRLQEEPFDLIITDLRMDGMSGLELGQEINRLYPDIPLVLTTGRSSPENLPLYFKTVIPKPPNREHFQRLHGFIR